MDTTLAITVFVNFIIVFLGAIGFFHKRDSITNILFFLISITTVFWSFANYFSVNAPLEQSLLWIRFVLFFAAPHAVFFLLFIYHFPKEEITLARWKLVVLLGLLIFTMWATLSPFVFSGVTVEQGLVVPVPGVLMPLFAVVVLGSLGLGISLAVRKYRATTDLEKVQWRFMLFGITVSYASLIVTNFILVVIYRNTSFISLAPLFMLPMTIGTTYAILEHHLLNIKVIATEIIVFVILSISFFEIFLAKDGLEALIRVGIFGIFFFFSLLLIKSVVREVEQREKLQVLTRELELANSELKKLDAAKSEFISLASHQLRAPLTIIKGYLSMLLEGSLGKVTKLTKEKMQTVSFSAEQMVKLVADLLNLSRIESGKIKYEFALLSLVPIVRNVIDELSGNALKKKISVKFSGSEKTIPAISLDKDKMREVAINLIDNAIKYSPEGEAVDVKVEQIDKKIRFSVKDSGIGIKPEDQAKLFTKFVRTEEASKRDPNGMGIGLYFVKRVIEDHGGTVGVTSEGLGRGSTFFVELPVRQK